jgi:secretion/DNA translocation related TadE-like protein
VTDAPVADSTERCRGSATVWMLCCAVVLVVGSWCVATLTAVAAARHHVADTADEAALAAAAVLPSGGRAACAAAATVATAAGVALDGCEPRPEAGDVLVSVSRAVPGPLALGGRVRAVARAGAVAPFRAHRG